MFKQFIESFDYIEIIGITASCLVLVSFILNGENKIRMVNIFGAALFIVYGFLRPSMSTWILNTCLVGIHIYKLIKSKRDKKIE